MPILGWIASGLASFVIGVMYEKESNEPVVESSSGQIDLSWWDKTLLVALGLGAYYIYKKVK